MVATHPREPPGLEMLFLIFVSPFCRTVLHGTGISEALIQMLLYAGETWGFFETWESLSFSSLCCFIALSRSLLKLPGNEIHMI